MQRKLHLTRRELFRDLRFPGAHGHTGRPHVDRKSIATAMNRHHVLLGPCMLDGATASISFPYSCTLLPTAASPKLQRFSAATTSQGWSAMKAGVPHLSVKILPDANSDRMPCSDDDAECLLASAPPGRSPTASKWSPQQLSPR